MRFPWVNVALLVLLIFQLVSGFLGLLGGVPGRHWILQLHDTGGYAIVVLLAWKGLIILDVLNRVRRWRLARLAFILLLFLLLLILVTGISWMVLGYTALSGFSLMTIHALAALALLLLLVWHVLARRFVFKRPDALGRRAFLRFAGITLAGLALWQFTEAAQAVLALPGRSRRFTGSYETGSRTGQFPTVSWILDNPAPVDREQWRLTIDGAVEHPLTFTYAQMEALGGDTATEILDCTGGWYSEQVWTGVYLRRLLESAGVKQAAQSISVESVTGYARRFALDEQGDLLLATRVADHVLEHYHGFPLRLVAPGHRGLEWVKWVTAIHVNETSEIWQSPVPLQ